MGLTASVNKCFRVVELWGNIPVDPDPGASLSRKKSVLGRYLEMPKWSACLRYRNSRARIRLRGRQTSKWRQGKGQKQRRDRGSVVSVHPQRRMQAIYHKQAGRSIEGRGEQGKKLGFKSAYGTDRLSTGALAGLGLFPRLTGRLQLHI
jgi:hypothetical protein